MDVIVNTVAVVLATTLMMRASRGLLGRRPWTTDPAGASQHIAVTAPSPSPR